MKIAFVSNYLNHHAYPLCDEFIKQADCFVFISTEKNNFQGYQYRINAPFVIDYSSSIEKCVSIIKDFDIIIFGSCPNELIKIRSETKKLYYIYTERFLKKGLWRRFIPSTYKKIKDRILSFKNDNMFVLCAGAYVSKELKILNFPTNKCIKWGYFPELYTYDNADKLVRNKEKNTFLWCGRFLDWKHPEIVLKLAKKLSNTGIKFRITMIGDGPEKNKVVHLAKKMKLDKYIFFFDSMDHRQIRKQMEASMFYLFTSDYNEGWGAVLNESMNSGCVVFASEKAGSTPFLINDGINGYVFKNPSINSLYKQVSKVIKEDKSLFSLQKEAYSTIAEKWNAEEAVKRILMFSNSCFVEKDNGPCSKIED